MTNILLEEIRDIVCYKILCQSNISLVFWYFINNIQTLNGLNL